MRQIADRPVRCYTNTSSNSNLNSNSTEKPMVNSNEIDYFLPGPNQDNDKRLSTEIIKQLQRDFEDVLCRMGCFDGKFLLQAKPDR